MRDALFACTRYTSGTPKFLKSLIKTKPASYLALSNLEISESSLDSFDIHKMSVAPLLFQTGYLTVGEVSHKRAVDSYILKMPNREVREAFSLSILADFTENDHDTAESAYWRIKESLEVGDLQGMLASLRSLFASIPYEIHVSHEHYYHSIFYAALSLLGFDVNAEVSVSGGRVDAVLEQRERVYVMEFKYEKCEKGADPEEKQRLFGKALTEGLKQIEDKGYAKKYEGSGKEVVKAAFAFLGRDDIEMRLG